MALLKVFHASLDLIDALGVLSRLVAEMPLLYHGQEPGAIGHGPTVSSTRLSKSHASGRDAHCRWTDMCVGYQTVNAELRRAVILD